jgi:transposase
MVVDLHNRGKSSGKIACNLVIATDRVRRWYRDYAVIVVGSFSGNGIPVFTPE